MLSIATDLNHVDVFEWGQKSESYWWRGSLDQAKGKLRIQMEPPEAASTPDWQAEEESRPWRGVFAPQYRRKVLFSVPVQLRTAELPRPRPNIGVNFRELPDYEDE